MLRWLLLSLPPLFLCLCIPPSHSKDDVSLVAFCGLLLVMSAGAHLGTSTPRVWPATVYGLVCGTALGGAFFLSSASVLPLTIKSMGWLLGALFFCAAVCNSVARVRVAHDFVSLPDVRKCDACGYDLRGLTQPRCPECGRRFSDERMIRVRAAGMDTQE